MFKRIRGPNYFDLSLEDTAVYTLIACLLRTEYIGDRFHIMIWLRRSTGKGGPDNSDAP